MFWRGKTYQENKASHCHGNMAHFITTDKMTEASNEEKEAVTIHHK